MAGSCTNHPETTAAYRCDGCGKLLCNECIEEGRSLLFCRLCGERALPLERGRPAAISDLQRPGTVEESYSWPEAVVYCLRGKGAIVLGGYVAALSVLDLVPFLGPVLRFLILLLLPSFLFLIVRTTAKGENELLDWPDFSRYGDRLQELLTFSLAVAVALLPTVALTFLVGCGVEGWSDSSRLGRCILALIVGSWVSAALWLGSFGATATYDNRWLTFRVDLHIQALQTGGIESVLVVFVIYLGLVGAFLLGQLLAEIPLLGFILANLVAVYGWLTSAHLIGVFFRRYAPTMERIYRG
jgi:hypothetical protein